MDTPLTVANNGPMSSNTTDETFRSDDSSISERPSNEYALNFAFLTFLGFTTVQFFFAIVAKSQSMMTDCAAMSVDVVTYLFNFLAERLKQGHENMTSRELRLHRLYMELIPPFISVTTLMAVTVLALREAIDGLIAPSSSSTNDEGADAGVESPDIRIMIIFSGLNLFLDILNVGCFARVHQAVGIPGGYHLRDSNTKKESVATEITPLVDSDDDDVNDNVDEDDDSLASSHATGILNLNMCSAWTHIFADTLRSVAVLIAGSAAWFFPEWVSAEQADSWGAIIVSVIILFSLAPLAQGLFLTYCKIRAIWKCVNDRRHREHEELCLFV